MARLNGAAWLASIFLACAGTIEGQKLISYHGTNASLSADGRYVAFVSEDYLPGDTNGFSDVYVHDLRTGTTTCVSVDSAGSQANAATPASKPAISGDGRFVAFVSNASNLVTGDTNSVGDIFVHDRQTATTTRVSVDSAGKEGNGASWDPAISADGRYVAFVSDAGNLVAGDSNGVADVFIRDRQAGATKRISVDRSGNQGNAPSLDPSISADGLFVAFASQATNLVGGDTNGTLDVFVRDRQAGTTTRVSVNNSGAQGNGDSRTPNISADARYVAFVSSATNLVTGDSNGTADIFVRDRQAGQTTRVSLDSAGNQGNGESSVPSISGDGRFVAFYSLANNLVTGDPYAGIFVRDRQAGETSRGGCCERPSISADGRFLAYDSEGSYEDVVYVDQVPRIEVDVSWEYWSPPGPGETEQFAASVLRTPNQGVTWSIHPAVGAITAQGLYTAPAPIRTPLLVTVNAQSVADPGRRGAAWMPLGEGFGDFDHTEAFGNLFLDGWTIVDQGTSAGPSNWKVIEGVLTQTSSIYGGSTDGFVPDKPGTYILVGDPSFWGYYTITARLRSTDNDAIGIMFGYRDANNYYRFSMDRERSYRRLVKVVNGVFTVLAADAVPYEIGRWYDVQITMARGIIQVLLDGQLLFDVFDTSHDRGSIGFYSWNNTGAEFDDLAVIERPTLGCTYSFQPTSVDVGPGTATGGVNVVSQYGCPWPANSSAGWITIVSGTAGVGSGTVQYSVTANNNPSARQGTLTLPSNATFTVRQAGGGGGLPLEDHFSSGWPGAWTVVDEGTTDAPSHWNVSGQVLQQTSNIYGGSGAATALPMKGTYALTGQSTWTDYKLSVRLKSTDDDAIGVMFGYKDANNYYRFSVDHERSYRRLVKVVNGTWTKLAEDSVAFTEGQWYTVEAAMAGGRIKIVLDGQTLFTVNDSSHTAGKVALYSWCNPGAQFDDVAVGAVPGTTLHCVSDAAGLHAALLAAASNGRHDVVRLVKGQYGGNFVYSSPESRDLTIEGGYTANCASRAVDPANTVLDGMGQFARVLKLDTRQAADFAIEGLTLRNGNASAAAEVEPQDVGGLRASTTGQILLKKNVLSNNTGIGFNIGGGASLEAQEVRVEDSTVEGNDDPEAGGMSIRALTAELRRNYIRENYSSEYSLGTGGVTIECPDLGTACAGNVIMANNTFDGNTGWGGSGGGARIDHLWWSQAGHDQVIVEANVFQNNAAADGGGISASGSDVTFVDNLVVRNQGGEGYSAGVSLKASGSLHIVNNTIVENWAYHAPGGLAAWVPDGAEAWIYNNILVGNSAESDSGPADEDLAIYNEAGSQVHLYNNDFDQSYRGTYIEIPFPIDPSNLNDADPLFLDAVNRNYRLQPASPVINKGSNAAPKLPATDIGGNARIQGGTVDMGAYEASGAPGAPSSPSPANGATGVSLTPTLTWTAGLGAISYDVYCGTSSTPPKMGNTTGTSYTPGTLYASKTYYWKVVAKNATGSTTSHIWSFKTGNPAPTNPTPANVATSVSRTPTLKWTAGLGAASHDVYFGTSSPPPKVGNVTGTSYTPGTLSANKKYYWKIVAKSSGGATTASSLWSFTTK